MHKQAIRSCWKVLERLTKCVLFLIVFRQDSALFNCSNQTQEKTGSLRSNHVFIPVQFILIELFYR